MPIYRHQHDGSYNRRNIPHKIAPSCAVEQENTIFIMLLADKSIDRDGNAQNYKNRQDHQQCVELIGNLLRHRRKVGKLRARGCGIIQMDKIRKPRRLQMRRNDRLNRFKRLIRYDKTGGLLGKALLIKLCRLFRLRMQLGRIRYRSQYSGRPPLEKEASFSKKPTICSVSSRPR